MTTQYTPTLKLALPVTGELSGTWGDVVNDNITSMIEQAIAGLSTINTWTGNAHTLTTANGTTSESRCAMLVAATGGGAPTAVAEIICPAAAKLYVLQNNTSFAVTLKTSAGTGVAVAAGDTAFLFCDGTNVNSCVTTIVNGHITGNLTVDGNTTLGNATSDTITATARFASGLIPSADNTYDLGSSANSWKDLYIDGTATIATLNVTTIDTTNLEVTNIKAKDGTAAIVLADATGVATIAAAPVLTALTASKPVFTDASKALTSSGTLAYDQGGTGQTSYATGDIVYASATNTLAKLAIGSAGQRLVVAAGVPSWATDATIGTVTSVAQSFTGGIVSVAGSPITTSGTLALTVAGTSGGVPYFSSGTTWATSTALAANALVIGGGAGAAPSTTTTGTGVVTALGVNTGTAGAFVVNGGALGTPSSGTVTNLTGTASININGTVGATTPTTGAFTTLSASQTITIPATTSATVGVIQSGANRFLHNFKLAGTDGFNTFFGVNAGNFTMTGSTGVNGSYNVGIGEDVLSLNTTGYFNSAVGKGSLQKNTTGTDNTSLGYRASAEIVGGNRNTSVGSGALITNISGSDNTAIGGTSLSSTTGIQNSGLGAYSGADIIGGANNSIVGYNTGRGITTGSGNTVLGAQVGGLAAGLTNNIILANGAGTIKARHDGTSWAITDAVAVTGTLSATGAVTLSGGTANGVAYLDGSKVLTTGSALTFDGTTLTGTASGALAANFNRTTTSGATVKVQLAGSDIGTLGSDTGGNAIFDIASTNSMFLRATGASSVIGFQANNAEQMRLTTTGLGIGTSSPAYKLDVLGNSARVADSNGSGALLIGTSSGANQYQYVTFGGGTGGTDYGWQVGRSSNSSGLGGDGAFYFYDIKANTTRMSIDSSGNLGLGVTPSAWSSASRPALQLTNGAALFSRTGSTFLGQNFFYNASDAGTYIANGFAAVYIQASGQHQWYNAPSGTAGNAAALTQAMTLDASGNLGIGTTSAYQKLSIGGINATNNTNQNSIEFQDTNGNLNFRITGGRGSSGNEGYGVFSTTTGGVMTERMRLDSSGNLGVGTTSPGAKLEVYVSRTSSTNAVALLLNDNVTGVQTDGVYKSIRSQSNSGSSVSEIRFLETDGGNNNTGIAFATAPTAGSLTERMRVGPDGNVGIGTTSPTTKLTVYDATAPQVTFNNGTSTFIVGNSAGGNNHILYGTGAYPIIFYTNAVEGMRLDSNGNLLVGTTNTTPAQSNVAGVAIRPDGISVTGAGALTVNRDSDGIIQSILRSGSLVGNISVTTLLTSYNTTSDYRLKTVSGAVSGQGSRIDALQPIEYTWNSNGSSTRGFLAHQFQEVYPSSVTGDKDAVDADGKPVYQSMQASTSEVIADLVAELQSLRARVAQLESKP